MITFEPDEVEKRVRVTILNDTVYEPGEEFQGIITPVLGDVDIGGGEATVAIVEDDGEPLLMVDVQWNPSFFWVFHL